MPSVEWWNQQLAWFVYTSLWTPHAIAALIACFAGFLLIWHAPAAKGRFAICRYALPAPWALASSFGASIWVMFVFGAFLLVWTGIAVCKRWFREVLALAIAGCAALALILPYLRDLSGPGPAGPLVTFTVRSFLLADVLPPAGLDKTWRLILYNGSLLPLNYALEFGFFLLAARYKWRHHRATKQPLQREDLAFLVMAGTSALICTFLRSSVIGNNDLGWRGFLVAQFVLLLWAADFLVDQARAHAPFLTVGQKSVLGAMLFLALAGTAYDVAILRFYPLLADRGIVPPLDGWRAIAISARAPTPRAGIRMGTRGNRAAAAVQANPDVILQDTVGMSYSARPTVAADLGCLAGFGGSLDDCVPVIAHLVSLFPKDAATAPATLDSVCRNLPVEMVVAKDTDPVWRNRRAWVWTQPAAYENPYLRVFRCAPAHNAIALQQRPALRVEFGKLLPHLRCQRLRVLDLDQRTFADSRTIARPSSPTPADFPPVPARMGKSGTASAWRGGSHSRHRAGSGSATGGGTRSRMRLGVR